jgi:fused signal recognition particle receptor
MFSFIKNSLKKIYTQITSRISTLFARPTLDLATLQELKVILLSADAGVETTKKIIHHLEQQHKAGALTEGTALKEGLRTLLIDILNKPASPIQQGPVFILVGINGSGKTTFAAKLAHMYAQKGQCVLLVAADTFRAAATQQLQSWATQYGIDIVHGAQGQDPASVIFAGCTKFKQDKYDTLIIDTAGRLHTKINLMHELSKIKKVIAKQLPNESICTLLTIDSMLGQNSLEQAKLFKECTDVSGIVLTKMDGTAKGGIVFAIANELAIPIWYITYGESIDQIKYFEKKEYVENLLQS